MQGGSISYRPRWRRAPSTSTGYMERLVQTNAFRRRSGSVPSRDASLASDPRHRVQGYLSFSPFSVLRSLSSFSTETRFIYLFLFARILLSRSLRRTSAKDTAASSTRAKVLFTARDRSHFCRTVAVGQMHNREENRKFYVAKSYHTKLECELDLDIMQRGNLEIIIRRKKMKRLFAPSQTSSPYGSNDLLPSPSAKKYI
jgi:hypothetical protein